MKKKIITLLLIGAIGLSLIGCSSTSSDEDNYQDKFEIIQEFDKESEYDIDNGIYCEIRNKETGVHYYLGKNFMCPVYDFNGNIKTSTSVNN